MYILCIGIILIVGYGALCLLDRKSFLFKSGLLDEKLSSLTGFEYDNSLIRDDIDINSLYKFYCIQSYFVNHRIIFSNNDYWLGLCTLLDDKNFNFCSTHPRVLNNVSCFRGSVAKLSLDYKFSSLSIITNDKAYASDKNLCEYDRLFKQNIDITCKNNDFILLGNDSKCCNFFNDNVDRLNEIFNCVDNNFWYLLFINNAVLVFNTNSYFNHSKNLCSYFDEWVNSNFKVKDLICEYFDG